METMNIKLSETILSKTGGTICELDKITGREFREEMINEIFSKFCIGK